MPRSLNAGLHRRVDRIPRLPVLSRNAHPIGNLHYRLLVNLTAGFHKSPIDFLIKVLVLDSVRADWVENSRCRLKGELREVIESLDGFFKHRPHNGSIVLPEGDYEISKSSLI